MGMANASARMGEVRRPRLVQASCSNWSLIALSMPRRVHSARVEGPSSSMEYDGGGRGCGSGPGRRVLAREGKGGWLTTAAGCGRVGGGEGAILVSVSL
jgi:hypothetical protein